MEKALATAAAITDQRQKIEQYKLILASVMSSSSDIEQAKRFIDHIVSDEVPLVVSRQLLRMFAEEMGKLDANAHKEITHYASTQIQRRVVSFEEQGAPVKVRRPSDYNPSLAAALGPSHPNPNLNLAAVGLTPGSAGGLEGPDRIFVGGLPYYFTEAQIIELLESFGPLRGFHLVKDRETGKSKGYAFCVYEDLSVTDIACAALSGIKMGDDTLTVKRASQGAEQPTPEQEYVLLEQQQVALQNLVLQDGSLPTKVVCLTQVVSVDELRDDEEYEDILEDIREEVGKYGKLVNIVIPRPDPNGGSVPGVGKVFLEYADTYGSTEARVGLNGRKFVGNQVVAVFFPENKYAQGEYDG